MPEQVRAGVHFRVLHRADRGTDTPTIRFQRLEERLGLKHIIAGPSGGIIEFCGTGTDRQLHVAGQIARR